MNHVRLIAITLSIATLSSCEKPAPRVEPQAKLPAGAKIPFQPENLQKILGDQFLSIKTCDKLESTLELLMENSFDVEFDSKISQNILMTITEPDPRNLKRDIKKDGTSLTVPPPNPSGKKPSKWDFDVNLPKPTFANGVTTYSVGLITIKLANNTSGDYIFRFVEPQYTLRAGNIAGALMFCDPDIKGDTATMKVVRIPDTGLGDGSFNFGLVIQDKNDKDYEIPVYFDPDVKNEG